MQVSWIDPDEIAKLAAQLEGPLQRGETAPLDLDTLPDGSNDMTLEINRGADFTHLANAPSAPAPAVEPLEPQAAEAPPDATHIRDKLRAIRARAVDAGLLPGDKTAAGTDIPAPEITAPPSSATDLPSPYPTPRISIRIPPAPAQLPDSKAKPAVPELSEMSPAGQSAPDVRPPPRPGPFLALEGSLTERLQGFMRWARQLAACEDILLVDDHGDLLWGAPAHADLALSALLAARAGLRSGPEAVTQTSVFIRTRVGDQGELCVLPCPTCFGMVTLALLNGTGLINDTAACLREALTLCIEEKTPFDCKLN